MLYLDAVWLRVRLAKQIENYFRHRVTNAGLEAINCPATLSLPHLGDTQIPAPFLQ